LFISQVYTGPVAYSIL